MYTNSHTLMNAHARVRINVLVYVRIRAKTQKRYACELFTQESFMDNIHVDLKIIYVRFALKVRLKY